jgi:hypothetical protein
MFERRSLAASKCPPHATIHALRACEERGAAVGPHAASGSADAGSAAHDDDECVTGSSGGTRGRIFRANVETPKGETAAGRSDIEVFFDNLPEPIDLELDLENRVLYWTGRGDPPRGNTVNRAPIDGKRKPAAGPEIVLTHLMEGIGIAPDVPNDRMFVNRLCWFDLFGQARRIRREEFSLCPGQSHRHRIRRSLNFRTNSKGESIMSTDKPIRRVAIIGTGVIGRAGRRFFWRKGSRSRRRMSRRMQKPR